MSSSGTNPSSSQASTDTTLTAVDYVREQDDLERQARELMPYEPNECTYYKGELRQPVFACLSCSRANNNTPVGVCYSCSIQCHSAHDIVELFTKRSFVCDCGTTRMAHCADGACKLRTGEAQPMASASSSPQKFKPHRRLGLPADDIPASSNAYNQNFKGLFCSCEKPYNPLEETGNMIQCYFGFACGEDWFHDRCILGYTAPEQKKQSVVKHEGVNVLDQLPEAEDEAVNNVSFTEGDTSASEIEVPHFPPLDDFDVFVCWKCVDQFSKAFEQLESVSGIVLTSVPHFSNTETLEQWEAQYEKYQNVEPNPKRIKLEASSPQRASRSVFLKHGFRDKLVELKPTLDQKSPLATFLTNYEYFYLPDPVYEPPEDQEAASSTGTLLDLGTDALASLPRDQAIEGLQAYDKIRSKLRDFFKPFAEQGRVVTEEEVRSFFSDIKTKKD